MRDTEAVASIVAGDPDGLAAAYDRYADPLFMYCRTLLGDDAGAADAVQDTFVIAAARLSVLDDPQRLRAWLFAVARAECSRAPRRSSSGAPAAARRPAMVAVSASGPPREDTGGYGESSREMTAGDPGDGGQSAGLAGLRTVFEDAATGLGPGEREIIGLHLVQGLDPDEVATVLGVSRSRAQTLLSRAGDQLENCLGALLVGRAGRGECAELGSMLTGWDGRLTVPVRKRVHRHIEHCSTCSARRAFELRPAMLLEMPPAAALAAGAAESSRLATGAPEGLKAHTIALATEHGSGSAAHAMAVLSRAGTFGSRGFPRAAHGGAGGAVPRPGLRSSPQGQAAVAAAVVLAVGAAAAGFALTSGQGHLVPVADPSPPASSAGAPLSTTTGATTVPATARTTPSPVATSRRSPTPQTTTPAPLVVPQADVTTTQATATAPGTPSSPPPAAHATTSPPDPTATPSPSQVPGTLRVFPGGGSLFLVPGGRGALLFLSASGGTVDWSVSVSGDPGDTISVSPAMSGTLTAAHPHVALSITASANLSCGQRHGGSACPTITIEPGGAVFTITSGRGHPFSRGRRHRH